MQYPRGKPRGIHESQTRLTGRPCFSQRGARPDALRICCARCGERAALPPACQSEAFRAFDFWIGDWKVSNAQTGELSGENTISDYQHGCALRESWSGVDGAKGESVTYLDPIIGKWRQRWISAAYGGYAMELEGGPEAPGRMVMTGETHFYAGSTVRMRLTWESKGANALSQTFEAFDEEKGDWTIWFTGNYARK